ncbi:probable receptor-like protein kinase At5g24010 [Rhodamnia argentea]|uniref:Probable receptor-like protein kinase At5g24010 n=1 Tax=Rhodamnia argentea TaxID=178133 RepID=A0A8B8Q326_9MYRT|nr:probable receptor-like protein kinase At5g24010 [Rhodamnia argentea]
MKAFVKLNPYSFLLLCVCTLRVFSLSVSFSPVDNHLINCGSAVDATVDNRAFVSDSSSSKSQVLTSTRTISLNDDNPALGTPQIYHTARAFTRPSKYVFKVQERGTHMVRLHFHRFKSSRMELYDARFHVLVDGYVVLSNFSGESESRTVIKEYLIWIDAEKLVLTFFPAKRSKFGFVNAIEVISAPKDLILETAQLVDGDRLVNFNGLNRQAFEVLYRVSVGGPKVTPFNDSLWRTWVPDDAYLKSTYGSERVFFGGRIKYQTGGASREVGPDNVYNSARVIKSTNATVPNVNMTWVFPATRDYKYLVRLHFCDIASISLELLYFNVYVNGFLMLKNFDLSYVVNEVLAAPFYADFVVDGDNLGILSVSIGPSNYSMAHAIDGLLNGVEVMKLNNSMGSLDGEVCGGFILKSWPRGNMGVLVPLVAVICLLLSISVVMHRRRTGVSHPVAWTRLPTDMTELSLKQAKQQLR